MFRPARTATTVPAGWTRPARTAATGQAPAPSTIRPCSVNGHRHVRDRPGPHRARHRRRLRGPHSGDPHGAAAFCPRGETGGEAPPPTGTTTVAAVPLLPAANAVAGPRPPELAGTTWTCHRDRVRLHNGAGPLQRLASCSAVGGGTCRTAVLPVMASSPPAAQECIIFPKETNISNQ